MIARMAELARFGIVGGIGFGVDAGMLALLIAVLDWSPLLARLVSFPIALSVTWLLNRVWTFRAGRHHAAGRQYVAYGVIQVMGAAINFVIYAALLQAGGLFLSQPVMALAAGAAVAMGFNYLLARRFAFAG